MWVHARHADARAYMGTGVAIDDGSKATEGPAFAINLKGLARY